MIDKDKSLTEKKGNIFKRFFTFIKSLFKKEKNTALPENEIKEDSNEEVKIVEEVNIDHEPIDKAQVEENYQKLKEKFFEKYNQYKKDEIPVSSLSDKELLMADSILKEETNIAKEKADKELSINQELTQQIESLNKQVKINQE